MAVQVSSVKVREMKTRWGSCTPATSTIRLNTELARRRPHLLEYIVVHEMCHLLEDSHNGRFYDFMDQFFSSVERMP